jgi:hypothetical protein
MENTLPKNWIVKLNGNSGKHTRSPQSSKVMDLVNELTNKTWYGYEGYGYSSGGQSFSTQYPYPTNIPVLTEKEFLAHFGPVAGEIVEVTHDGRTWVKRAYITTLPEKYPDRFVTEGVVFGFIAVWKHMRRINKEEPKIIELTIEDIAKLKGVSPEQIRIKK